MSVAQETIDVEQFAKQQLKVSASTILPLASKVAFAVITHHQNEKIFRHIEECTYYQVLQRDEANGRVVVESEHTATWRLLAFSGKLRTRLRIEQDHEALVADFKLVPGRFNLLRMFEGRWSVLPQPPECCSHCSSSSGECCLVTLEQDLQPAFSLPPPLGTFLRQLACRQLKSIFEDLRSEAARINSGRPTLWRMSGQPETPAEHEVDKAAVMAAQQQADKEGEL